MKMPTVSLRRQLQLAFSFLMLQNVIKTFLQHFKHFTHFLFLL